MRRCPKCWRRSLHRGIRAVWCGVTPPRLDHSSCEIANSNVDWNSKFEARAFDFFCNGDKACDEFSVAILRSTKICNFNAFFQSSAKASDVSRFEWSLHKTLLPTLRWARVNMRRVHQKLRILCKISWVNFFSSHPVVYQILKVSNLSHHHCGRDAIIIFFGGGVTWPDLVTWPLVTWT